MKLGNIELKVRLDIDTQIALERLVPSHEIIMQVHALVVKLGDDYYLVKSQCPQKELETADFEVIKKGDIHDIEDAKQLAFKLARKYIILDATGYKLMHC